MNLELRRQVINVYKGEQIHPVGASWTLLFRSLNSPLTRFEYRTLGDGPALPIGL
jgi:hypothetical protein